MPSRRPICPRLAALAAIAALAAALPAAAVDLFVKPSGSGGTCAQASPCTLATAVATAAAGDAIYLAAGVYTGPGTEVVALGRTVSLLGGWNGAPAGAVARDPVAHESVLDGENARRAVKIVDGSPTLDGLTMTRGNATGLGADCNLTAQLGCGGGILVANAGLTLVSCTVAGNVAVAGPAGPSADGYGGGLHAYRAAWLLVEGCTFRGNTASVASPGTGGGIDVFAAEGGVAIQGNRFVGNRGTTSDGHAGYGGGVALRSCRGVPAEVGRNLFVDNAARVAAPNFEVNADGDAILVASSTATVAGNRVRSGPAATFAVMFSASDGEVRGNTVIAAGGSALYVYPGNGEPVAVTNNVLVGGSFATLRAHGSAAYPVVLELAHNTIAGCPTGTGVLVGENASATLVDTIVSGHGTGIAVPGTGNVVADHTLFWNNASDGFRGNDPIDGDPRFVNAPAGDFHIRAGSAAIGAGVDAGVTADIDGEARPGLGGFDVGADELAPLWFDFGTPGSPVEPDFTQVTHLTTFTPERGFGWTYGTIASRDRGTGDLLHRDLCFTHTGTFAVAVPDGRYRVALFMGDAAAGHGQMAVFLENQKVAVVSTAGNEFVARAFETAVSDGQLTVWLNDEGGADPNVVINALTIEPALPVLADLGTASSPVAAGYARATHATRYSPAAGIGWVGGALQSRDRGTADPLRRDLVFTPRGLLGAYLANGIYDVLLTLGDAAAAHDRMGVSVQGAAPEPVSTARNQFVTRRWRTAVADNRLEVLLDDLGGADANAVLNAVEVRPAPPLLFDFGTPTSPVAAGHLQVTHATAYSPQLGYGWLSGTVASRDRAVGYPQYRDFNFTRDGTFVVDVLPGVYTVGANMGDPTAAHDQMGLYVEGELVDTVTTGADTTRGLTVTVAVTDGQLTVRIADLGGSDPNAVINVLQVR